MKIDLGALVHHLTVAMHGVGFLPTWATGIGMGMDIL
jgi:hypothetical protein